MAIEDSDWNAIYAAIERYRQPSVIVQGKVIKNDTTKMLVWLREFGDQPIPIFTFDYEVKVYDTVPNPALAGTSPNQTVTTTTVVKKFKIKPLCPKVGETVLVLRQYGSRRLPKCLGVLRSQGFVLPEEI